MSQEPGIIAEIDINGEITVDAHGLKGKCKDIIKDVDAALSKIGERTRLQFREESKNKDSKTVAQNTQGA